MTVLAQPDRANGDGVKRHGCDVIAFTLAGDPWASQMGRHFIRAVLVDGWLYVEPIHGGLVQGYAPHQIGSLTFRAQTIDAVLEAARRPSERPA